MAHPKHRTSKHKKRIRRSHLHLSELRPNHCPRCGEANRPHCVCENCGHYGFEKGGQAGTEVLEREEF